FAGRALRGVLARTAPAGGLEEVLRIVAEPRVGLGRESAAPVLGGGRGTGAVLQLVQLLLALDDFPGQRDDLRRLVLRLLLGGVVLVGGDGRRAVELVQLLAHGVEFGVGDRSGRARARAGRRVGRGGREGGAR